MEHLEGREVFLKSRWNSYPPVKGAISDLRDLTKVDGSTAGRVVKIDHKALTISKGNDLASFELGNLNRYSMQVTTVLRENDIVQIWIKQSRIEQIELLAPRQIASPHFTQFQYIETLPKAISLIRSFFTELNFDEIRTPYLVPSPGMEPHIEIFETKFQFGSHTKSMFLPTSPEFHLKKALTMGFEKIFELKECFRNEEVSSTHQPEFCMLEYYRAFSSLSTILYDLSQLTLSLCKLFEIPPPRGFETISMKTLWRNSTGFELTPQTQGKDLIEFFNLEGRLKSWDFDDIFHFVFIEKVEPFLLKMSQATPVFLTDYPPSQAALARINEFGWAERAEMYWKGFEIANGFGELNDPEIQLARYKQACAIRQKNQKQIIPLDEELIQCLKFGMPPSAGIAVGVERLLMAILNIKEISQLRLFPVKLE